MIDFSIDEHDDDKFLAAVDKIVNGAAAIYHPMEVYVVHINGWFDHKWLQFSGTVMHEVAVWKHETTLPPFHPNRVLLQRYYHWDEAEQDYKRERKSAPLHIYQESAKNLKRKISDISNSAMLVWYSCNTNENGKGSLMAYIYTEDSKAAWFIAFDKKNNWQSRQTKGISVTEMLRLEEAGKQLVEKTNQPIT